jgi:hypothetical protein
LGAAIAKIAGLDIAEYITEIGLGSKIATRIVNFACPIVGNENFEKKLTALNTPHYHYRNYGDAVPYLILPNFFGIKFTFNDTLGVKFSPDVIPQYNEILQEDFYTSVSEIL